MIKLIMLKRLFLANIVLGLLLLILPKPQTDLLSPIVPRTEAHEQGVVYAQEPEFNEQVRNYIKEVFAGDEYGTNWALFVSWHEGITFKNGYREYDPEAGNLNDMHGNGNVGSFGVWQFGYPTYNQWCEPSENWKTDWKAQTRCAKKIWDAGMAPSTWAVNWYKFIDL